MQGLDSWSESPHLARHGQVQSQLLLTVFACIPFTYLLLHESIIIIFGSELRKSTQCKLFANRNYEEVVSPDQVFNMAEEKKEDLGDSLPDQKVLLAFDNVYKFKKKPDRLGSNKNRDDLIKIFQDNFDCSIMPGKDPHEGEVKHLFNPLKSFISLHDPYRLYIMYNSLRKPLQTR